MLHVARLAPSVLVQKWPIESGISIEGRTEMTPLRGLRPAVLPSSQPGGPRALHRHSASLQAGNNPYFAEPQHCHLAEKAIAEISYR